MRTSLLIFVAVCEVTVSGYLQSAAVNPLPDLGVVHDNTYSNQSLGISWNVPPEWSIDSGKPLVEENRQTLVRVLPNGKESNELVELDYVSDGDSDRIVSALESKGWETVEQKRSVILGGGIVSARLDFKTTESPEEYLVTFLCERRGERLMFLITASNAGRANELVNVVRQMRVQPDWGTPEEPMSPVVPGSIPRRVRISESVSVGLVLKKVPPKYPEDAREAHIQGSVLMLAHISTEGAIKNIYVLSGEPVLAKAALAAVSQWTYRPYLLRGRPRKSRLKLP